jgi:murein DD-endopeptidase MepM/ murein hydrolase activator NlpD
MQDPREASQKGPPSHLIFHCFPLFGHPVIAGSRDTSDGGSSYIIRHNTYVQGRRDTKHHSFDIHADEGTAIVAPFHATVHRAASDKLGGFNITLYAKGPTYKWTMYCAHLTALVRGLKVGDRVVPGIPIALVGATGDATGPHLHMTVTEAHDWTRDAAYRVDPGAELFKFVNQTAARDHYKLSPAALQTLPGLLGMEGIAGYAALAEAIALERYGRVLQYSTGGK